MAGGTIDIELKGTDKLISNLRKLMRNAPDQLSAALYKEAQLDATEAKKRTPVATGALRNSCHVRKPFMSWYRGAGVQEISVTIGFGGPVGVGNVGNETNAEPVHYALHVHENLDARHGVGQAKYLESVINESRKHMPYRIGRRFMKDLEGQSFGRGIGGSGVDYVNPMPFFTTGRGL